MIEIVEETITIEYEKLENLKEYLLPLLKDGLLVAFSGGVDSAFLLWAAKQTMDKEGGRVFALTTTSASLPDQDKKDVEKFISEFGIDHKWIESKEMENPAYLQNDNLRCYHCKTELFSIAKSLLKGNNLKSIAYGYNASDFSDDRPGHKASIENGILAPLAEIGFSKDEIRTILRNEGINISEKQASPCLSSRISHGVPVTTGRLADISFMENILRDAGVSLFRVRLNETKGGLFIRIEIAVEEFEKVINIKEKLNSEGRARNYKWVTLDLGGYKMGGADK
ncbi:MAG: ATP-dependent sacrificial sulfur transferase LarE [Calditrichaeota bacterium]|nr:MAG: ATP-dependent sacrificial sulfur transferase LarE [Calditrichota bacterium]MBL1205984.1 ATP-dependent sacrificial sulfur transferase LarE [Calditrichota bacterium]NOG45812.1 ATP-dependent sacrificial sulfur transferase LarE [Calditrichota bacterium]